MHRVQFIASWRGESSADQYFDMIRTETIFSVG
jgi:hypothetical protein